MMYYFLEFPFWLPHCSTKTCISVKSCGEKNLLKKIKDKNNRNGRDELSQMSHKDFYFF